LRKEAIFIFLLLFFLWILLNGGFTLERVLIGLVVTALVWTFLAFFLGHTLRRELFFYRVTPWVISYLFLALREIFKANRAMLPFVFGRKKKPEGTLVEFHSGLKTPAANAILASSITITPGTITVLQDGDRFLVHCLVPEFGEGMDQSAFVRMLKRMEGLV
jgi:multicomponent Na+:H+ antiporter subunit E